LNTIGPVRYSIADTGSAVICASIEVLVNSTALPAERARKFARQ
jgi:hypothetical protein